MKCISVSKAEAYVNRCVSADNLDFLHSFARVFCGNQKSSWHGTTVQVVQPLPSLSLPGGRDITVSQASAHTGAHTAPHTGGTRAHAAGGDLGGDFTVSQASAHTGAHTAPHTGAHSGAQTGGDFTVTDTSAHSGAQTGGDFTVSDTSAHSGAQTGRDFTVSDIY